MRFLPALVAGSRRSQLPLSDSSADCLGVLALAGASAQSAQLGEELVQRLKADPPLAVWATCLAWTQARFQPDSLADLAVWLAEHLGELLVWPDESGPPNEVPATDCDRFAEQVTRDLETAELVVQASKGEPGLSEGWAHLLATVAGAQDWLTITVEPPGDPPLECLPPWLAEDSRMARHVQAARRALDGAVEPNEGVELEACRMRADQGRREWLKVGTPLAACLPALCKKLARLAQLEHHFQEVLENEKLEAMAEFAAGAGHEINNPLAIIAGRAQLLLAEETDPERRRELAVANAQVKRAYEMIADMRLFARPPRPELKRFDLVRLADALVVELASQGAERSVVVRRMGDSGPLEIEADPTQLEVALRAMGKNALEWIAHNGQIQVDIRADDREVHIAVADDGPGLLPEHRRHLFDPFYSARQAGRGLGLGLSKCWRIVTNHGGRIEVESQPGQGARFTIHLPRQQGAGRLAP